MVALASGREAGSTAAGWLSTDTHRGGVDSPVEPPSLWSESSSEGGTAWPCSSQRTTGGSGEGVTSAFNFSKRFVVRLLA
jgi:hypothetical protein